MKYTEDQIDSYLRGEMSAVERAMFEAEMEQDTLLARDVNMMRMIIDGLKDRQEKVKAISSWQEDTHVSRHAWVPWVTAFSAAAVVVAGVFLFHPTSSPTLPPDTPAIRTTDISSIDSLVLQGSYQEALQAIEAEIAETDSLLQESFRIREEADYDVRKYEYALKLLREKLEDVKARQKVE